VTELGVQVDRIVVAAPLFANVQCAGPAEVADEAPNGSPGEHHGLGDFAYGAVRIDGNVEEDSTVAGYEIKVSDEAPL